MQSVNWFLQLAVYRNVFVGSVVAGPSYGKAISLRGIVDRHNAQRGRAGGELFAKQWQYDAAGDVIQKRDQRYGTTSYRYDPTGRIVQAVGPGLLSEVFRWDAAANLVSSDYSGRYVEHNRLKMFEDKRFSAANCCDTSRLGKVSYRPPSSSVTTQR